MVGILDPVLGPLLNIEPIWAIAIVSLTLSILSVFATKFLTNQNMMKQHRAEMKEMQKKMRKLQKDDPKKVLSMQKQMMDKNMVVMKESFKPMLLTIIPFLLIFAWLNANFSYLPIAPGEEFSITAEVNSNVDEVTLAINPSDNIEFLSNKTAIVVDKKANWNLKSTQEGLYTITYATDGTSVEQDLKIGDEYSTPEMKHKGDIKKTVIGYEKLNVNLLAFEISWFWAYFIFSIIFSLSLRKLLKVY